MVRHMTISILVVLFVAGMVACSGGGKAEPTSTPVPTLAPAPTSPPPTSPPPTKAPEAKQPTTGEVGAFLDKALDAAKAGDWEKAKEELQEALDVSTDPQQKAAIEEIIEDIEKQKYDEVVEDLEKLLR